ncbi:MAG TPA: GNAT family N-acetyltransferase [Paracoccaceae bacterium]|nr:GNAT family N-acetyltransferase [Paracoccaceae bacterium]HMO72359.1 GNAT family N-acetyltransferase [Paracoccaceae bacterium]
MPQPPSDLVIRPLEPADEPAWRVLWRAYLGYYETEVSDAVYATSFARMLSGQQGEFRGLIALQDGQAVGLAHYLIHRHGWKIEPVCYLQDLFTAPQTRGRGVARALIEAVYAAADAAGAPAVWWLTQEFNYRGRMLYDQVGVRTPFIRYNRR